VTTVAVVIEHGSEPACSVEFGDGAVLPVGLSDLPEYVSERGNPGNAKNVRQVRLRHPSEVLAHGVVLVDTPGVGSTLQHNTDAAYQFLPEADAAVFVLGVDPPATGAEVGFLRHLRDHVSQTFFVLNKADLLTEAELVKTTAFVRQVVAEATGISEVALYPLSARQRDAGYQRFREQLEQFLLRERGRFLLERGLDRARAAQRQLRATIDLEERSLGCPSASSRSGPGSSRRVSRRSAGCASTSPLTSPPTSGG